MLEESAHCVCVLFRTDENVTLLFIHNTTYQYPVPSDSTKRVTVWFRRFYILMLTQMFGEIFSSKISALFPDFYQIRIYEYFINKLQLKNETKRRLLPLGGFCKSAQWDYDCYYANSAVAFNIYNFHKSLNNCKYQWPTILYII